MASNTQSFAPQSAMRHTTMQACTLLLALLTLAIGDASACNAPANSFCVDYFNYSSSNNFIGSAVFTTTEPSIDHTWNNTSPNPSVPVYNFSGHWQGQFNFNAGNYIFSALADDGVRVLIDGQLVIDGWKPQAATQYTATVAMSAGQHLVEVLYFQAWGGARLAVNWTPVLTCDQPVGQFCVAYFNNANLAGNPGLIAHEASINHTWTGGPPAPGLPTYNFSGRWQGSFDFAPGTYAFTTTSDDGVRLYVDGQLLINDWLGQAATQYNQWLWLSGRHQITVEYFQAYGNALLQANWSLLLPASTTPPAPIGSNAASPLGTNLSDWSDWVTEQPFINVFKSSRSWITQAPGVWDTGEEQALNLDANGWVVSLPAATDGTVKYRTVTTLLLDGTDFVGIRQGGQYVVLYDGEGILTYSLAASKIASLSSPGRDVINVDQVNSGGIQINLTSTDPNHTGNYIRNIRVVPPGVVCNDDPLAFCLLGSDPACQRSACISMEAAAVSGRLFHPLFLRNLVNYRALRFMMPQNTNVISSGLPQQVNWTDRAKLDAPNWSGQAGIPVEVAVSLSNLLQADPWLNMPFQASDDYIRQFARLAHTMLDPSRKVYVEYANEIWNTAFSAGTWVEQQGVALWNTPDSAYTKRINWYGMRTAETCDIWKAEWAGDASRVVCVLSAQAANTFTANAALDCKLWNQAPCQAHGIQAVAIAPYFGDYLGTVSNGPVLAGWTANADGGLGSLFAELEYGGQLAGGPTGGALAQSAQWITNYASLARHRNLTLLAYEGGQSLVGIGSVTYNQSIANLFIAANRDPRMGDIYAKMLENWRDAGGGLFMHFLSVGQFSKFGSWGALENMLQQTSPKYGALYQFIQQNPR